jgi:hypothetical protein
LVDDDDAWSRFNSLESLEEGEVEEVQARPEVFIAMDSSCGNNFTVFQNCGPLFLAINRTINIESILHSCAETFSLKNLAPRRDSNPDFLFL